jgi:hypothetical protein
MGSAGILQSIEAMNRVGIGLSYRPVGLHRLVRQLRSYSEFHPRFPMKKNGRISNLRIRTPKKFADNHIKIADFRFADWHTLEI